VSSPAPRQRLDKWLWHARLVKTRTGAAELIRSGYVRVNGRRAEQVAKSIIVGDLLTVALPNHIIVLKVLAIAERRGPYSEASKLYQLLET
jgi:ribosome-associated heat shock protein Hsp15